MWLLILKIFFMCLFAIHRYFLVKCLFSCFAYFKNWAVSSLVEIWELMYSEYQSTMRYVTRKYFLPLCGLCSWLLNIVFCGANFLILIVNFSFTDSAFDLFKNSLLNEDPADLWCLLEIIWFNLLHVGLDPFWNHLYIRFIRFRSRFYFHMHIQFITICWDYHFFSH